MRRMSIIAALASLTILPCIALAQSAAEVDAMSPDDRRAYLESMSDDERKAMLESGELNTPA